MLDKNIIYAEKMARKKGLLEDLEQLYENLPQGKCNGCANCCRESVPTFFVEFLNIFIFLKETPLLWKKTWPKILSFFYTELVRDQPCAFLEPEGGCSIYSHRPLACRTFGFSSYGDYNKHLKDIKRGNRQVKRYYKNAFGLTLPNEVVEKQVEFCEDFEPERIMSGEERAVCIDEILTLDGYFLSKGLLSFDQINMTLMQWFALLTEPEEKISRKRIQISKEILEKNESVTLEKTLKTPSIQRFFYKKPKNELTKI